ncbi:MAG TPA: thioredoxin domain-containing protein [Kribbella sp.]|uniref:DsbA family protein n=1 Tax=Kribbella sp. TaxID=1871183 RepID=UPI002D771758|nr:thioredoxin domain-containing protein [Kribbella sp.]HET6294003.1 thioredoxin domain-containing protein [Kribbella sp.]
MSKTKPPVNPLLQSKRRRIGPGVIVVIVLVLALGGGVGVQYWRSHSGVSVSSDSGPEPTTITGPGTNGQGVKIGQASAKVNIDLFIDFRCPHCEEFESESGSTINQLVADGTATVTYWPLTFVSPDSPRLANAFAAAASNGKAQSYANEIYADFAKSWTDDQLLDLGKQLGIDDAKFETALKDNSYAGWLESIGQEATTRKVEGTPTVFVNDKMLAADVLTPEGIQKAVIGAAG